MYTDYICTCLVGQSYNDTLKTCENAKVFPGQLQMTTIAYKPEMSNSNSPEFNMASYLIIAEKRLLHAQLDDGLHKTTLFSMLQLDNLFKNEASYDKSIVHKIEEPQTKIWKRQSGIVASVDIIFNANSEIKSGDVNDILKEMLNAIFTQTNLCDNKPCDKLTTECTSANGVFNCTCFSGYIKNPFSERSCSLCPSGTKLENSECVSCPFGLSGINCTESWKLALVITACVLGALLLIVTAMLPVIARKSKSSKKSKESNFGNPQASQSTKAPTGGASGWMPRIPRAAPKSSWDRGTNLEMTPSDSHQNLIPGEKNPRLYEDINDRSGSQYGQNRPQYNPYGQNRATTNPYAQSRGQANPYYAHDDGERLN
ncbi:protein HEG homolog 1-like [Thalassophryne amazonica]|uniref:protein HEG homolog 1-like n=1 Tax=Thalassophryne amazonica TaxID=390379 RepID=UPI001471007A|nr:protein HEG homolog 1-like [Thalassophryne amazonica]